MFRFYRDALIFAAIALVLAGSLGWAQAHSVAGVLDAVWIVLVLGVLEVSLSFDNAIVNATVLRGMAPIWRRRFLLWGILIAVFGMRVLFPLVIVAIAGHVGPVDAVRLAATDPATYQRLITGAHTGIAGFGGAFLAMVGLAFFLDEEKESHWVGWFERPVQTLARISGLAIAAVLMMLFAVSRLLPAAEAMTYLVAGIFGLVAYVAVDALGDVIGGREVAGGEGDGEDGGEGGSRAAGVAKAGLGAFLYLEMLDASFSFDGVIGAFALSSNLFVIGLGLGIGAMFVRAMTVMLVERGTLARYAFLEHGAFYAILALAGIMLVSVRYEVPDAVTGLVGAGLIGLAFWASVRHRNEPQDPVGPTGERLTAR